MRKLIGLSLAGAGTLAIAALAMVPAQAADMAAPGYYGPPPVTENYPPPPPPAGYGPPPPPVAYGYPPPPPPPVAYGYPPPPPPPVAYGYPPPDYGYDPYWRDGEPEVAYGYGHWRYRRW